MEKVYVVYMIKKTDDGYNSATLRIKSHLESAIRYLEALAGVSYDSLIEKFKCGVVEVYLEREGIDVWYVVEENVLED